MRESESTSRWIVQAMTVNLHDHRTNDIIFEHYLKFREPINKSIEDAIDPEAEHLQTDRKEETNVVSTIEQIAKVLIPKLHEIDQNAFKLMIEHTWTQISNRILSPTLLEYVKLFLNMQITHFTFFVRDISTLMEKSVTSTDVTNLKYQDESDSLHLLMRIKNMLRIIVRYEKLENIFALAWTVPGLALELQILDISYQCRNIIRHLASRIQANDQISSQDQSILLTDLRTSLKTSYLEKLHNVQALPTQISILSYNSFEVKDSKKLDKEFSVTAQLMVDEHTKLKQTLIEEGKIDYNRLKSINTP